MEFLHDFDNDFLLTFEACEKQLGTYPEVFRDSAITSLKKHNPFLNKRASFICYLLPFWLKDVFKLDLKICSDIAISNTFGMLYFFIQDDVIDTPAGEYKGDQLPIGNLFFMDFIGSYQKLFQSDSKFWIYFRTHLQDWATSIEWERSQHFNKYNKFEETDISKLAGKVAPIKITCEAMALISNKETLIEPICKIIDYILVSMQMLDDWADWKKDLSESNCTYFLSRVMEQYNLTDLSELTEIHVRKAVYINNILEDIFLIVENNHISITSLGIVEAKYLSSFSEFILEDSKYVLREIEKQKNKALQGTAARILNESLAKNLTKKVEGTNNEN